MVVVNEAKMVDKGVIDVDTNAYSPMADPQIQSLELRVTGEIQVGGGVKLASVEVNPIICTLGWSGSSIWNKEL